MVTRNIGTVTAGLVYDYFDPDALQGQGASLIGGPRVDAAPTPPNEDTPNSTTQPSDARGWDINVPAGLAQGDRWRVLMRVGHTQVTTSGTAMIIDDEVMWEIRIQ